MKIKSKVDIILPVYKEQDNIERVLSGIKNSVKTSHSVNLIFYSKKDPTIPVVKSFKNKYGKINLLIPERGKGLLAQYTYGFKKTTSPIVVIMMSDLSDDPSDIDKMVHKIEKGFDFVCASRYMSKGKRRGGSTLKALMSYLGCETYFLLTGLKSHDATNAYKCFRREILNNIKIESIAGYEMPLELIVKSHNLGYKITEIPTIWTERDKGYSKFKLFSYIPQYMKWYLWGIKKKYLRFIQSDFNN